MPTVVRDSGAVDTAVMALLASDPMLAGLLAGGGVFADRAPQGQTKFVIVSVIEHRDAYAFLDGVYETFWILAKAVTTGTDRETVKAAGYRIHELLQNGDALQVPGARVMDAKRDRLVDGTEYDERSQRFWQHCGGLYLVELTWSDGAQGDDPMGYYAIDTFGGDRNVYQETSPTYPSVDPVHPYAAIAPGTVVVIPDEVPADGRVFFEASARLQAGNGGSVARVALFNLDRQTMIPGSELTFTADDTIGTRQRSPLLTVPPAVAYGVLVASSDPNAVAVWGAKLLHEAVV